MSFDVAGDAVIATASVQATSGTCGSFGATFGAALTGSVAPDGTFTVQNATMANAPSTLPTLIVAGTVPKSAGAPWAGTYSFSESGPSSNGLPACGIEESGSFTASPIANVTGDYTGTGAYNSSPGLLPTVSKPVAMTLSLQQGANVALPGSSALPPEFSSLALSGSGQLQGIPCFASGSTGTAPGSVVEGSRLRLKLAAADGTTAEVLASILDVDAKTIAVSSVTVQGGPCTPLALYRFSTPLLLQR